MEQNTEPRIRVYYPDQNVFYTFNLNDVVIVEHPQMGAVAVTLPNGGQTVVFQGDHAAFIKRMSEENLFASYSQGS